MSKEPAPTAKVVSRTAKRTDSVTVEWSGRDLVKLLMAAPDCFEPVAGILEITISGGRSLRIGPTESVSVTYIAERELDVEAGE